MRILSGRAAEREVEALARRQAQLASVEKPVRRIVEAVRAKGDSALRAYAHRWDGLGPKEPFKVPPALIEAAWAMADPTLRAALTEAATNIRAFATRQKPRSWTYTRRGISLGQLVRPLDSVGCYVPGGRYPLLSTVLMTVIPAQVAGVPRVCIASPNPQPQLLAAAGMLGIQEFYRIGGAQAVAALAYGTRTITRVEKIVGPGNSYVTAAKKLVAFDCGIDFLAGPTEAVIVSDRGRAEFIAADLLAQAEHDPEALAIFVTTSQQLAQTVKQTLAAAAKKNPIGRKALARNGRILLAADPRQAIDWANQIAPEHITVEADAVPAIQNAGSIFVGDYSAQAAGDYASGPNHVLPTAAVARTRGGLSVLDFVKVITVQKASRAGLSRIASTVTALADAEGLKAHADSIRVRCGSA
jgi:histidinol dehydrogenase